MGRALVTVSLVWATACGPQIEVPTGDGGSTQGSTSEGPPLDTGAASTVGPSTTDPSASSNGSTAAASDDTGASELVPPESVLTSVTCHPGEMVLLVEVLLVGEIQSCLPPPLPDDVLFVGIRDWDGLPGTFVVSPDGPGAAIVGSDWEELSGTMTLEVSAPMRPSVLTVDLAGPSGVTFEGVLDLGLCPEQNEAPCE